MSQKIVVIVLVGAAIMGWVEREKIKAQWHQYNTHKTPQATPTALYTWTDKEGTVHYSTTPDHKNAKLTSVDTGKISRLEPLPEPKKAAQEEDKLLLLQMREELIHNRNKMQAEKERRVMEQ